MTKEYRKNSYGDLTKSILAKKKVINLKTRAKRSSKRKEKKRKEKKKKRFQCDKAVKLPKRRRDKKQNKGKIIRIKLDKNDNKAAIYS